MSVSVSETAEEKWEDVAPYVSTRSELPPEHAEEEAATTTHAVETGQKALRLTVPHPLTSLWLGKVERKEHHEIETFEGLRGFSSEDLAMLAEKDVTVGAQERVFVDAQKAVLLMAGHGPALEASSPKAAEEVAESVEGALQATERTANAVEDIALQLAKVALLVTGFPWPVHGAVGAVKAAMWGLQVGSWGTGAFFSGKKLEEWVHHAEAEGLVGLFSSKEILQGAAEKALTFAGNAFGAYAGRSAEVVGGFSAELVGGAFAEVIAGGVAEVKGGISAEVIGGAEAALKSSWGKVEVLGSRVEIGAREGTWFQKATSHVDVQGTHLVELTAGSGEQTSTLKVYERGVRIEGPSTELIGELAVGAPGARLDVSKDSILAAVTGASDLSTYKAALEAALAAYRAARESVKGAPLWVREPVEKASLEALIGAQKAAEAVRDAAVDTLAEKQPAVRVTSDGVKVTSLLATVEVSNDGTVTIRQEPSTRVEVKGGAVKIEAPQGLTITSGPNRWTFDAGGARGPGMAGH